MFGFVLTNDEFLGKHCAAALIRACGPTHMNAMSFLLAESLEVYHV